MTLSVNSLKIYNSPVDHEPCVCGMELHRYTYKILTSIEPY